MAQWFKFALFLQRTFLPFPELMHAVQLTLPVAQAPGESKATVLWGTYTHMQTYTRNNK